MNLCYSAKIMSAPIIITVPNNYLAVEDMESDVMVDVPPPSSRKRRLDHLSWEEKMQRKKLKNRVAAQTSRDRKKAKMDEMEGRINHFMEMNERLLGEVENLKLMNERLLGENAALRSEAAARTVAGAPRPAESHPQQKSLIILGGAPAGDPCGAPAADDVSSLADLLAHFDSEEYLDTLTQLADSLLKEINAESAGEIKDVKDGDNRNCTEGAQVVGSTTKHMESSESRDIDKERREDINRIRTQHSYAHPYPITTDTPIKEENGDKGDLFYASYEANDCITVEVTEEVVEDVPPITVDTDFNLEDSCSDITFDSDMKLLSPMSLSPTPVEENLFGASPSHTCLSSDVGYESLASPLSEPESLDLSDFWCESLSELFPGLA